MDDVRIRNYTVFGRKYQFICTWRNTHTGFAHDATLLDAHGNNLASGTVHYINRTWEHEPYDTVCSSIACERAQAAYEEIRHAYKAAHGYERMTKKREQAFENLLNENAFHDVVNELNTDANAANILIYRNMVTLRKFIDRRPNGYCDGTGERELAILHDISNVTYSVDNEHELLHLFAHADPDGHADCCVWDITQNCYVG